MFCISVIPQLLGSKKRKTDNVLIECDVQNPMPAKTTAPRSESLESIEYWKKLYYAEMEKRRNLQREIAIERDRNKQLHFQLQEEKQDRAQLCETIGVLKNQLSNVSKFTTSLTILQEYIFFSFRMLC